MNHLKETQARDIRRRDFYTSQNNICKIQKVYCWGLIFSVLSGEFSLSAVGDSGKKNLLSYGEKKIVGLFGLVPTSPTHRGLICVKKNPGAE
jgi:hypothetical protein